MKYTVDRVVIGAEILVEQNYSCLRGKSVGIIANPTSVLPSSLQHIVDRMALDKAAGRGINITAVFGPEHGFRGAHQDRTGQPTYVDARTGLTVYNTYGLSASDLTHIVAEAAVDAIVFDIQDVGSRFYTYISTMVDVMVAAATLRDGATFVVLDRPNPIGGLAVRGPVMQAAFASFVGRLPGVPIVHGMTAGELARLANARYVPAHAGGRAVALHVVAMRGWARSMTYADTGLPWVLPSPNMPTLDTAIVYPGTCLLEASTLSEGRGTTRPFQIVGAPFLDWHFADALRRTTVAGDGGVLFREAYFTPTFSKFVGNLSAGVDIVVQNASALDPLRVGLEVLTAAKRLAPTRFGWLPPAAGGRYDIDLLSGGNYTRLAVERGETADTILAAYDKDLASSGFEAKRRKYLLYPAANESTHDTFCNFTYAVEHGYSVANLSALGVNTHNTWYVNGNLFGSGSTLDRYLNETADSVRASLRSYVATSYGKDIAGGFDTTNTLVLDIETPVSLLPNLGIWARNDPATFTAVVDAFKMRVTVTAELFPHAKIALYGSPIGPGKHAGNYTLAIDGLVEAGRRGMFDRVSYLLPVLYFCANESSAHHDSAVFNASAAALAGAEAVRTSDGRALPVLFSTKFTYGHSLARGWGGFVECDTTAKLIDLVSAHPSVEGFVWWFYPDNDKDQPSVSAIEAWFEKCRPVPEACLHDDEHQRPAPMATVSSKKNAFYAFFEPMMRAPGEWPSKYERFRDGVIVMDPYNASQATVAEVQSRLNATVLMYWDTNDLLMHYSGGQCLPRTSRSCDPATGKYCSTGHVACCESWNCSYASAAQCGPDAFPRAVAAAVDTAWTVRALPPDGSDPVPQCRYFFGLNYVPFKESVEAIGRLLTQWVRDKGFDGIYLDEYFAPTVFARSYLGAHGLFANLTLDANGDGKADSMPEILDQYTRWRNALTALLREELGPSTVLIANTAGPGADPNLNGITLEMEACAPDPAACAGWFRDQEQIGAKPAVSVIWTCNVQSMPAQEQCEKAASYQAEMPWVQVGSAWYDGPRVLCN